MSRMADLHIALTEAAAGRPVFRDDDDDFWVQIGDDAFGFVVFNPAGQAVVSEGEHPLTRAQIESDCGRLVAVDTEG